MSYKPLSKSDIKSLYDVEADYIHHVKNTDNSDGLDLGSWLPGLRSSLQPLMPGQLLLVQADTGVGKSAILQHIAIHARPRRVLFFELEMPNMLTFPRFMAMYAGVSQADIADKYRSGVKFPALQLDHIDMCERAGLTIDAMYDAVSMAEIEGDLPYEIICVDYIGLLSQPGGKSRYEKMSILADNLKVMAKESKAVVVLATQIHRRDDDGDAEVFLHDSRDSGQIEANADVVLGAWRPAQDKLCVKVCKNRQGPSGLIVDCEMDGPTLRISQCPPDYREVQ